MPNELPVRGLPRTLLAGLFAFTAQPALGGVLYVDQATGDDSRGGGSPDQAVATLARGAELLQAGDQLIVGIEIPKNSHGRAALVARLWFHGGSTVAVPYR